MHELFRARRRKTNVNIVLKEAGETDYWLEVIQSAGYFSDEEYASLDADNKEPTTNRVQNDACISSAEVRRRKAIANY